MATKEGLLTLLEERRGEYLSGEELAGQLGVSRTAVWKAARALREAGYEIDAVQNRGYCLYAGVDLLTESGIRRALSDAHQSLALTVLPCATSTNALLREWAAEGAREGTVVLTNQQTRGRGRLGREFFSPPDSGVYMSILLRPRNMAHAQAVRLTTMAAVAACGAVEALCGKEARIKWVNDIFLEGRKVCGILTEAASSLESGQLDYVVLGVGFNVYPPEQGFPDYAPQAGSILQTWQDGAKNRLAAGFLNRLLDIYQGNAVGDYAALYRQRSMVIGRDILVRTPTGQRTAHALDVDRDCRLVVRYTDGTVEALSSAEVSISPD